jgi:hypothetical protein
MDKGLLLSKKYLSWPVRHNENVYPSWQFTKLSQRIVTRQNIVISKTLESYIVGGRLLCQLHLTFLLDVC